MSSADPAPFAGNEKHHKRRSISCGHNLGFERGEGKKTAKVPQSSLTVPRDLKLIRDFKGRGIGSFGLSSQAKRKEISISQISFY
jgi:hypothetical protein